MELVIWALFDFFIYLSNGLLYFLKFETPRSFVTACMLEERLSSVQGILQPDAQQFTKG